MTGQWWWRRAAACHADQSGWPTRRWRCRPALRLSLGGSSQSRSWRSSRSGFWWNSTGSPFQWTWRREKRNGTSTMTPDTSDTPWKGRPASHGHVRWTCTHSVKLRMRQFFQITRVRRSSRNEKYAGRQSSPYAESISMSREENKWFNIST